jgi:4-amino-4-deoxy-L-arabinose transferase-like glycosyltransferase
MIAPSRRADVVAAAGAGAASLVVYLISLLPGVGYSGDTAKWQFIGVAGGVPHATGYPLYVALDQVWVRLVPFGSIAWRVNLLSAVLGAATVAVLYLVLRQLGLRREVALATTLLFAFSQTFWTQAVVAEVYTLHLLFLVTVTACLARWRMGGANAWLLAGLGVYAISFGHHLTTGLALPGIAWLVWSDRQRALTARNVAFVAAAVVVGASQYLYLMRLSDIGAYHEGNIDTFGDVLGYVTGGEFKDSMFIFSWYGLLVGRVPMLFRFLRHEYFLLLAPMAVGVWQGVWRASSPARRDVAVHLFLLGLLSAFYVLNYDVPDVIVFCLPLFLVLAVFLGVALDAGVTWLEQRRPADDDRRRTRLAVAGGLAGLVAVVGLVDYGRSSQRGTTADADRIERALAAAGTGAVLLTDDYGDSEYLWYYLLGEGLGEERDLALANQVKPAQVAQYFSAGTGPVAAAALEVEVVDPPLYTATAHQAVTLADHGLGIAEVAPSVWRVTRPTPATSPIPAAPAPAPAAPATRP